MGDSSGVSKTGVLQGLVLDETLGSFQNSAISTIQNMAASYTAIAHVMQKQKTHETYMEESFQNKLNEVLANVNSNNAAIKSMQEDLAGAMSNWAQGGGGGGGGGTNGEDAAHPGAWRPGGGGSSTEKRLDMIENMLFRRHGTPHGHTQHGTPDEEIAARLGTSFASEGGQGGRVSSARSRVGYGSRGGTPLPVHPLPAGADEEVYGRIERLEGNLRDLIAASKQGILGTMMLSDEGVLETEVPVDKESVQKSVMAEVSQENQRLERQMNSTVTSLGGLESNFKKILTRIGELDDTLKALDHTTSAALQQQAEDMGATMGKFAGLSRQFQAQHSVLDTRLENYRTEFDGMLEGQAKTLMTVEKHLERKADVRLVLDKVSRSEYTTQIKKLQQADDHIAARAVAREEYKSQLAALRDSISEDQKQRHQNIARIANELQKLVADVSSKASKADLIDVASVLNSFPKVHEEIDHLKVFVNEEIQSKADKILETTVDKKQLKRTMARLLKSLNDEITAQTNQDPDDAIAMRTGMYTGTTCLTCSTRLKRDALHTPHTHPSEAAPSRGGGFMLNSPRRPATRQGSVSGLSIGSAQGVAYKSRPQTSGGSSSRAGDRPGTAEGGQPRSGNLIGLESLANAKGEIGSDGKLYAQTGSRTHRFIHNPKRDGHGSSGPPSRRKNYDQYARELKANQDHR